MNDLNRGLTKNRREESISCKQLVHMIMHITADSFVDFNLQMNQQYKE